MSVTQIETTTDDFETILDGNIEFAYQPLITEGIYSDTDPKNVEILHSSLHMLSPVQPS